MSASLRTRAAKRGLPKPVMDDAVTLAPSRAGMLPPFIYTSSAARDAMLPYLKFPMEDPSVFYRDFPRLLLAYSAAGQGVPLSVAAMCNEVPDLEVAVLRYTHNPGACPAIISEMLTRRRARADQNVVFIIKHTERAYRRNTLSSPAPSFFVQLHDVMHQRPLGKGVHLAVACFEAVPTIIPEEVHEYLPVQVYFGPPATAARERLFQGHIEGLTRHCTVNPKIATWVKGIDEDESLAAYLADSSEGASVGHISDFIDRIAHEFIGFLMHPAPLSPNLEVDMDFVRKLLHDGTRLTKGDPNQAEDEFRAYAGLPQTHHHQDARDAGASMASIFATPVVAPERENEGGDEGAAPRAAKRKKPDIRLEEDE